MDALRLRTATCASMALAIMANRSERRQFLPESQRIGGGTRWWGTSIEGLLFCEANTNYIVDFFPRAMAQGSLYYQATVH